MDTMSFGNQPIPDDNEEGYSYEVMERFELDIFKGEPVVFEEEDYSPTDVENESNIATDGSERGDLDEDKATEVEGPDDPEEPEVDQNSSPLEMLQYFERRNKGIKHAVYCENDECRIRLCRRMKNEAEHLSNCQNRILGRCVECQRILFLVSYHTIYCKFFICMVPYCNAIRGEAAKTRKNRMEAGS